MVQSCRCPEPNPECNRAGIPMVGRMWELCSGKCPAERPCTALMSEQYRALWDGKVPPTPTNSGETGKLQITVPQAKPGTKKNKLWKFMGQMYSYLEAHARWKLAGSPVPSPEQLAEREAACKSCPYYDVLKDGCKVCGCGLDGGSLDEKRRMATEMCPAEPPRWEAIQIGVIS
jgi:hypothetical protein